MSLPEALNYEIISFRFQFSSFPSIQSFFFLHYSFISIPYFLSYSCTFFDGKYNFKYNFGNQVDDAGIPINYVDTVPVPQIVDPTDIQYNHPPSPLFLFFPHLYFNKSRYISNTLRIMQQWGTEIREFGALKYTYWPLANSTLNLIGYSFFSSLSLIIKSSSSD